MGCSPSAGARRSAPVCRADLQHAARAIDELDSADEVRAQFTPRTVSVFSSPSSRHPVAAFFQTGSILVSIANTPAPPYYAAIFSSIRTAGDEAAYETTGEAMAALAMQQPG